MLEDPAIRRWLGGVEPAWTMLDRASFAALRHPPSPIFGPIRLAADLTPDEFGQSPVARNALAFLSSADAGPGLKLTAKGNLSRAAVAELIDRVDWPDFDKTVMFQVCKVINETDFFPLHILRNLLQAAKLIRRHKGHFKTTPEGRKMSREPNIRALQAMLFHIAFWYLDLAYFTWSSYEGWPQRDAGLILWSLSVAAHDWQSPEQLTRLCTIPPDELFDKPWVDKTWDVAAATVEGQFLRYLTWFGLLEFRKLERESHHLVTRRLYRKTALFDRFLSFDVQLSTPGAARH
jgi:hypothetical protein